MVRYISFQHQICTISFICERLIEAIPPQAFAK